MDSELPMFPLGSVLFPFMPARLRVFEERYLVMLSRILQDEPSEFGVVLIERGQEVGGGEHRFDHGTVAQISEVDTADGSVLLTAQGVRRVRVTEWLPDDPYPRATVREVPELVWDDALLPLREKADAAVRRALAAAPEFDDQEWPADVWLSQDPVAFVWQLAAIAPIGPLDQVALLKSSTTEALLHAIIDFVEARGDEFSAEWPAE